MPTLAQLAAPMVLGGAMLVAYPHDARAQTADGGAGDAAASGDAAVSGDAALVPVMPEPVLGGVPIRTGGEPPRHGACACDIPHAAQTDPGVASAVVGAMALLLRRRRAPR